MFEEIKKEILDTVKERWGVNSIFELRYYIKVFKITFPHLLIKIKDITKNIRNNKKENISEMLYIIDNNIQIKCRCKYCHQHIVTFVSMFSGYIKTCCAKCRGLYISENMLPEVKARTDKRISNTMLNKSKEDKIKDSENKKAAIKKRSPEKESERKRKEKETKSKRSAEEKLETERKRYITKKKNGTLNTSKEENIDYLKIKEIYPNTLPQYMDKSRYPFACDLYISELDLFIEINDCWTHGIEPFDKTNKEHINIVLDWFKKSKELNHKGNLKLFYKNAIYVWTNLDPRKLSIAKQNNLNFLNIYPKDRPNLLELISTFHKKDK